MPDCWKKTEYLQQEKVTDQLKINTKKGLKKLKKWKTKRLIL